MRTLWVETATTRYPIQIGSGLLKRLPVLLEEVEWTPPKRLMVVTDTHVAPLYLERVIASLTKAGYSVGSWVIPAGETSKSLSMVEQMAGEAIRQGLDRKSGILALGGGVVGDAAGFLAATYMRGIPFVQLPTTLLAHDSSVGGKVGVNHPLGKNMVGAFHQPDLVVFDVDTLKSLPAREMAAGFAEVIKEALIRDDSFVSWLEENRDGLMAKDPALLAEAIERGCRIKAEVVSQDEKESGLRAILNYGHTIGHALEAVTGYRRFIHGEAVAIGMVGAAMLGETLGLAHDVSGRTRRLIQSFELPVQAREAAEADALIRAMRRDKKSDQGSLTFVLPRKIGSVEIVKEVPEAAVRQVLSRLEGEMG
ncbi:3-dehydroquinate synthase [Desmospora profundinema]|uniref:3-dehydroquinate synthase n=1 Tax=Desmospora profundinema TaxID=1571184 RepID=A0ABU1IL15_9BACL|nr:3-dehydroquinate synthase [Desmospora profundinema]MDR6224500.1 3-dehydroquinate synthase [Desmospora profundinema]